eukprot:TRINITY_DN19018_c0_g1_i1.p2 TRINITY_DN19018_c0_g1~~TRINITY_DN19018_c0_g1_i1.p2  ORF type:complete len:142 (+),score=22.69 TRINITY_DN19018_c0_g1_i1:2-427(+)
MYLTHLCPREKRQAQEVIDFPFTLVRAYLTARRRGLGADGLASFFGAMASESCINLRFLEIMTVARDILGIRTVGQTVMDCYKRLNRPEFEATDTLALASERVLRALKEENSYAWDEVEHLTRPITETDVRASLQLMGFET